MVAENKTWTCFLVLGRFIHTSGEFTHFHAYLYISLKEAPFRHQSNPELINDPQQSKAGGASQALHAHDPVLISRKSHHPASPSSWRRVMTSQRQRHATRALPTQNSSSRSSSSRSGPSHVQATSSSSRSLHTWPEEAVDDAYGLYSLHRMFDIVGTHLTRRDVRVLSFLFVDVIDEYERGGIRDGRDFLLALERQGRCDETNFRHLMQLLRIITRHDLLPYVTLRKRQTVCPDPVDQYLEETSVRYIFPRGSRTESPQVTPHRCTGPQPVIRCPSPEVCQPRPKPATPTANRKRKRAHSVVDCREKQTCDIRLRVRAEYCQHDSALQGNVFSNKQEALERQFERFNQANTILKSRDLGSIICDIKFSELTYLDAFWRDYINGSLLEALKGVFITDSLKQAVGHEAIKLLVNVDEEDYQAGRRKLLRNLMMGGGVGMATGAGLGFGPGSGSGSGLASQGAGTS
ncbi:death effector domain-containing protein isoform 1-T1 [Clarias gariepinus]